MELLDSLSSNWQASTVVELSLNPLFRRDYNSLYKGIQDFLPPPDQPDYQQAIDGLFSVVSATVPPPAERTFYPGRIKGEKKVPRTHHQVIKKQSKRNQKKVKVS